MHTIHPLCSTLTSNANLFAGESVGESTVRCLSLQSCCVSQCLGPVLIFAIVSVSIINAPPAPAAAAAAGRYLLSMWPSDTAGILLPTPAMLLLVIIVISIIIIIYYH